MNDRTNDDPSHVTLPPEVEAEVAERLRQALAGLDADPVDVGGLAVATRAGVRRAGFRRRSAVAAAAAAAIAVPLSLSLLVGGGGSRAVGPGAGDDGTTTATATATATDGPTDGPTATGTPTATPTDGPTGPTVGPTDGPTGTAVGPSPSDPVVTDTAPADGQARTARIVPVEQVFTSTDPWAVAYLIPPSVTLHAKDFPRVMGDEGLAMGDYRFQPTVSGQGCDPGDGSPEANHGDAVPVAGTQYAWDEKNSTRLDELQVDVVVSGWRPGTGHARFQDVVDDTGACRFVHLQTRVGAAGMPGDEAWAATSGPAGLPTGRALVRQGDLLIGVEVVHPDGRTAAVTLAKELVTVLAERARTSGLVDTAAAGG